MHRRMHELYRFRRRMITSCGSQWSTRRCYLLLVVYFRGGSAAWTDAYNRRPSDVGIRDRWRNGVKATIRTQIDDTCLLTDAKGLCGTTDILQDSLAYLSTESGEDITACEGARMWVQEEYLDTLFSLLKP